MNDPTIWPVGGFDDVRRLRVLRAAMPATMLAETMLRADFHTVWSVLGDVETGFPGLVPDVRTVTIIAADGERMRVLVRGRSGLRAPFDMVIRPGWCLMQSRLLVFGMAAEPAGDDTRFAYLAGLRPPGRRLLQPLLAPSHRWLARTTLRRFHERFDR